MNRLDKGKPRRLFYRGFATHDHVDVEVGDDPIGVLVAKSFDTGRCPNCSLTFTTYRTRPSPPNPKTHGPSELILADTQILFICRHCGWWQLRSEGTVFENGTIKFKAVRNAYAYHSLLEEIDISSNLILMEDLKAHLIRKWDDRRFISASKAEQLVAAILKDHLLGDVYHATANTHMRD